MLEIGLERLWVGYLPGHARRVCVADWAAGYVFRSRQQYVAAALFI